MDGMMCANLPEPRKESSGGNAGDRGASTAPSQYSGRTYALCIWAVMSRWPGTDTPVHVPVPGDNEEGEEGSAMALTLHDNNNQHTV